MATARKRKLEGLCENTADSKAIFGFRKGDQVGIDIIPFCWAARRGDTVVPLIPYEDGSIGPADIVDGYLGVESGPIEDEDKVAEYWVARVETSQISLPENDDEDDDDDEDDEQEDDGDDDEEPVRIRPRRR